MKKIKLYVVGPQKSYAKWIENIELTDKLEEAKIVLFTGGQDIDPKYYNCANTNSYPYNNNRDEFEINIYKQIKPHQFIIGICRGMQLGAIMNGALLIQHLDNHSGSNHSIINSFDNNIQYEMTSLHHQAVYPFNLKKQSYTILYHSNKRSNDYLGDKINCKKVDKEIEVILFHKKNKPKMLGIQGHPEMLNKCDTHNMLNNLIKKLL